MDAHNDPEYIDYCRDTVRTWQKGESLEGRMRLLSFAAVTSAVVGILGVVFAIINATPWDTRPNTVATLAVFYFFSVSISAMFVLSYYQNKFWSCDPHFRRQAPLPCERIIAEKCMDYDAWKRSVQAPQDAADHEAELRTKKEEHQVQARKIADKICPR